MKVFSLLNKDKIFFWVRYVDDVFAIIDKKYNPNEILALINNLDHNIEFTIEIENQSALNYLDVTIIHDNNNQLITKVYRKPNSSLEIIHNNYATPKQYKLSTLRSYINQAILISFTPFLLKEEIKFTK